MTTAARMTAAALAAVSCDLGVAMAALEVKDEYSAFNPEGNWGHRPKGIVKLPRNKPCPCGSGRKAKHCCVYTKE